MRTAARNDRLEHAGRRGERGDGLERVRAMQRRAQAFEAAIDREYPELRRWWQIRVGPVAEILRDAGFEGAVPNTVEAAIYRDEAVLAFGYAALTSRGKAARRFLHEMGHAYWHALPPEVQAELERQFEREIAAAAELRRRSDEARDTGKPLPRRERERLARAAGPLFDGDGRLKAQHDLRGVTTEVTEWFAERIAAINAARVQGRLFGAGRTRAEQLLRRAAQAVLEVLRRIARALAHRQGADFDSDFWQAKFERFIAAGGRLDLREAGRPPKGRRVDTAETGKPLWADEFEQAGGKIENGTILLWHATTQAKAKEILETGVLRRPDDAPDSYGVYASSSQAVADDYGDGTLVPIRVRVRDAHIDDVFPGRRVDFMIPTRQGQYRPLAVGEAALKPPTKLQFAEPEPAEHGAPDWPADFPRVTVQTTVARLQAHPDYDAAKSGDDEAAMRIARDLAKPEKLRARLAGLDTSRLIWLPVKAVEASGRNKLPLYLAHRLARTLGGAVDTEIVQANIAARTGSKGDHRMRHRPEFDGPVTQGAQYILVDDVTTMGGTFAELRAFVEKSGGQVIAATAYGAPYGGTQLAVTPKTLLALRRKFGDSTLRDALTKGQLYGGNPGALTEAEARYLLGAKDVDTLRNRATTARGKGVGGEVGPLLEGKPEVEFAEPEPAASPAAAQIRVAREAYETARDEADDALDALEAIEAEEQQGPGWKQRHAEAKQAFEEAHERLRKARQAYERLEDDARLEQAARKALAEKRREDPREALLAQYEELGAEMERAGTAGNWPAVQLAKVRRAELRDELDREWPGWRQEWRRRNGGKEPPMPEEALGTPIERQPGEDEPLPPPPREYTVTETKRRTVEGHSLPRETLLARTWARIKPLLTGWKPIPELPAFPEAWWNRNDPFLRANPQFYNKVKEGLRALRRAQPGILEDAAAGVRHVVAPLLQARKKPFDANAYERLRSLLEEDRRAKEKADLLPAAKRLEIVRLQDQLEDDPYVLFERLVMYLDFEWRATHLFDENGDPITLPGNLNLEEVRQRLEVLRAKANAHPAAAAIAEALQRHHQLVRDVAQQLKERNLLGGEHLENPWYFPHLLVEKTSGKLERVKVNTAEDFRGYLVTPIGSPRPIETDYVRAMYHHLVQVGAHNAHADIVEEYFRKPYDVIGHVRDVAKELSRKRGVPVSWTQAFYEQFADEGYVLYGADDGPSFIPALAIDRERLARLIGHELTAEPIQKQLRELGLEGVQLRPEDISEALLAGEREYWVIPEKVAEALRGIQRRETRAEGPIERVVTGLQGLWKRNILFAPWNYLRYEFNNTIADLEKLISADPGMARKLPQAMRDVLQLFRGDEQAPETVRQAMRLGVLESVTAHEINSLHELPQFDWLATDWQRAWRWLRRHNTVAASRLREATFRYAKFLADLERLNAGARPVYAGAYWKDIEAIGDSSEGAGDANARKAAEISLKTFGDYGDISVNGDALRRWLVPFYSWMEINFRYHANLVRNLRDALRAHDKAMAEAQAKAVGRAGAVAAASMTRQAVALFALRFALPYLAVLTWNNSGERREVEDDLSEEDKRRFHIVIGRDENGKALVIYAPTAFSDVARWFSGPEAARLLTEVAQGKTDWPTALAEWRQRVIPDFLNNTVGSTGPLVKVPIMAATRKNFFPDVTEPRTIPRYDLRRSILSAMTDMTTAQVIEQAVNKDYVSPKDFGEWAQQVILQVRRRDPEQWAYFQIRDQVNDFIEKRTGQKREMDYDAPDQQVLRNFRRAIYRGDVENALRMYDRLLELGYTAERLQASVRAQDPLSGLAKGGPSGNLRREFIESLDPHGQRMLELAYRYYSKMSTLRGRERLLFPRRGRTERQAEIFRRVHRPRPELIIDQINRMQQIPEAQRRAQIERDLQRSLRQVR